MKTFIIAEAGVNHNGDINLAKRLINIASMARADAVKFQTFKSEYLVKRDAKRANYQIENTENSETQFEMLKKLELDVDTHKELIKYCNKKQIIFLSTPFDLESIKLLNKLGLEIFKIPSGEITNFPLIREVAKLNKKIILSTGMSKLCEIEEALEILINFGTAKKNITVLHCNTDYPTKFSDVNLKAMLTIKEAFKVNIGYSDHTLGIEVPISAVALGAGIIEKHFTLDRDMQGPDHKASLTPIELKKMVKAIRNIEIALGDGVKKPTISESKNIEVARKSIIAKTFIKKGELFSEDNLTTKRPATGINPMRWSEIIGKKAKRDFSEDELIEV